MLLLSSISRQLGAQPLPKLIPYRATDGWGYCDSAGKILIVPRFERADFFHDGKAVVSLKQEGATIFCVINEIGDYIIPPSFHWNGEMRLTRQYASLNVHDSSGQWGMVNMDGAFTLPFRYDARKPGQRFPEIPHFMHRDGWKTWFMIVSRDGKQGVLDTLGNILVPFIYDAIMQPVEYAPISSWIVGRDSLYGLLGLYGNEILPLRYKSLQPVFERGLTYVTGNGKMGVIDLQGHWRIPALYDKVVFNTYGPDKGFQLMRNNRWGRADSNGTIIIPTKYEYAVSPLQDYFVTQITAGHKRSMVLLNNKNEVTVRPGYDRIDVRNDTFFVTRDGKRVKDTPYAFVSIVDPKTGRLLGPLRKVSRYVGRPSVGNGSFCGTAAANRVDWIYPHIDSAGREIAEFTKDSLRWSVVSYILKDTLPFNTIPGSANSYFFVSSYDARLKRSIYAVVDERYRYIIPPQSTYVIKGGSVKGNWLIVHNDSGYAVVDTDFRQLIAPMRREIRRYFRWRGKPFTIAYKYLSSSDEQWYDPHCFECNCTGIFDSTGNFLTGFSHYCDPRLFYVGPTFPYSAVKDTVCVLDSLQRIGFLHLNGTIVYPEISFKYKQLAKHGEDIFLTDDGQKTLVNSRNHEYLPGLSVYEINKASDYSAYTGYKTSYEPSLLRVQYRTADNNPGFFYMSLKGKIYAEQTTLK